MNAQEQETARNIIRMLDQGSRDIGSGTAARLAAAREQAMAGYRETPLRDTAWVLQLASRVIGRPVTGLRYLFPAAVLVLGLIGIVYWQSGNGRNHELADLDARLLTDDLPIDAYLDKGFDSWLKRQSR